jgi:hypothetical protein
MPDDEQAFRALTLLLAVCEQALLELEVCKPPFDETLQATIGATRDAVYATLTSARFTPRRRP